MISVNDEFYAEIRRELGAEIPKIRKLWEKLNTFLPTINPDRAHFIYELLQNAEDSCERARTKEKRTDFRISFELLKDKLRVSHNGITFDRDDVIGISEILEGTKENDPSQIGKFGIGFKSVFLYSESPEVYSGDKSFRFIKGYPYGNPPINLQNNETVFILPLGAPALQTSQEKAYADIEKELTGLDPRVLLFLRNLSQISIKISGKERILVKEKTPKDKFKRVVLYQEANSLAKKPEEWMVFDNSDKVEKNLVVEVAYKVENQKIARIESSTLFCYLPTSKETHLKFLIQGPFHTSPARDNIQDDDFNQALITKISELIGDSISALKSLGLLNVDFLCVLPIETSSFVYGTNIFRPIYDFVRDLFSSERMLPTDDGGFVTKNEALIARGEDLRKLFAPGQLKQLFGIENSKWLDPAITPVKTPELWNYLRSVLIINVIEPDDVARKINAPFMQAQTDGWLIAFYRFFADKMVRDQLKHKPIIRLQDNSIVTPLDNFNNPNAYLPTSDQKLRELFPNTIKKELTQDKIAIELFKALGIEEPNVLSMVMKIVLPKYASSNIALEENLKDIELIMQALNYCPRNTLDSLIKKISETQFLMSRPIHNLTQCAKYSTPTTLYFGKEYTGKTELETYFQGNPNIWFLDSRYAQILKTPQSIEQFKQIGVKCQVKVVYREPGSFYSGCTIEGLEYALDHISVERAKIVWELAKQYRSNICAGNQPYVSSFRNSVSQYVQYSVMGRLLVERQWLPDINGTYHKPSELLLSDLPEGFDNQSSEAIDLAHKLNIKPEPNLQIQEIIARAPPEMKTKLEKATPLLEMFLIATPEQQEQILESTRKALTPPDDHEEIGKIVEPENQVEPSISEISDKFMRSLEEEAGGKLPENEGWKAVTLEQEESMRQHEEEIIRSMPKVFKEAPRELTRRIKPQKGDDELKAFLRTLYDGHCQICKKKLELGGRKPSWFNVYHLIEKRDQIGDWSSKEFNALCVCPNCQVQMKKGGRQLRSIVEKAEKVLSHEDAPEPVLDLHGLFYVVNVYIAGEAKELFYHPYHMAKVAAFISYIRNRMR